MNPLSNDTIHDSAAADLTPYLLGLNSLKSSELNQLENAHRHGYLVTNGRDQRLSAVWKAKCQALGRPFVRIRRTGHSATLYLELPRDKSKLPPRIQNALIWLCQHMPGRKALIGTDYVICSGWPLEDLEQLAVILLPVVQGSLFGDPATLTASDE